MVYILLLVSLAVILFFAEVFTNGIEWLGKKLNLSEGAVGSLLAAVGTALPETMIPVIAILFGSGEDAAHIGIGAILGAPFMLSTIAMGLAGFAALAYKHQGTRRKYMLVDESIMRRDLTFFILVYAVALGAAFLPKGLPRTIVALFLVGAYAFYAYHTLQDGEATGESELHPLMFAKKAENPAMTIVLLQTGVALGGIVFGAHLFVDALTKLADIWGIPAFILSIIIAPIATELPEKFNSIIWIRQGKDTLALGNITGAMVFQSSIVPALGIALTPWKLSFLALTSGVLALTAAGIVYYLLRSQGKIKPTTLITVGSLYLVFIAAVIYTGGGTH
ncbi:MAG: hypothetical protein JG781_246 [Peptococcaceae bacterium]|jgi:cation:H+ antiporter|nr:hypothetical protein [Peptococcaceae bacterium]